MNDPILEASSGLKFAPYNITYHGLKEQALLAGLDPNENKWELLFDFSASNAANFEVMDASEFKLEHKISPGYENRTDKAEVVFGFPQRYGGQLSNDKPVSSAMNNNLSAFDIKTGLSSAV